MVLVLLGYGLAAAAGAWLTFAGPEGLTGIGQVLLLLAVVAAVVSLYLRWRAP